MRIGLRWVDCGALCPARRGVGCRAIRPLCGCPGWEGVARCLSCRPRASLCEVPLRGSDPGGGPPSPCRGAGRRRRPRGSPGPGSGTRCQATCAKGRRCLAMRLARGRSRREGAARHRDCRLRAPRRSAAARVARPVLPRSGARPHASHVRDAGRLAARPRRTEHSARRLWPPGRKARLPPVSSPAAASECPAGPPSGQAAYRPVVRPGGTRPSGRTHVGNAPGYERGPASQGCGAPFRRGKG